MTQDITQQASPLPSAPSTTVEAASRWRPLNAIFFVGTFVLLCVWLELFRLGLMYRNAASISDSGWHGWVTPLRVGLRFDIATLCFALAPLFALIHIPWLNPADHRRGRRFVLGYLLVFVAIGTYALMAEFEFFREFQVRYNRLALQYWDQPGTVVAMIWNGYPVVRYTLLWLVVVVVVGLALNWWIHRVYANASKIAVTLPAVVREVGMIVLVVAGLVIGMRGGLQHEPLRWGDAFQSDNDAVNQFSLNGIYCLAKTANDELFRHSAADFWTKRMPLDTARQSARSVVLDDDEQLLNAKESTVLRTGLDRSPRWLTLKPGVTKPNVVVVLMESGSARMSERISGGFEGKGYTPEFDCVAGEGVLFKRAFSIGTHTHQGVFGTMLSFPNLPGYEAMMQNSVSNQHFTSLPSVFEQQGYQTLFLYNGDFAWDNMRGFFRKQGINKFIGRDDFPKFAATDKVWGVNDHQMLTRANEEFEAAAKNGPFFGFVLTLSNHSPFLLPEPLPFEPITGHGEMDRRLNAVRYADWAIGKFIEEAKTKDYFKNTVFVFCGDHGFNLQPKVTAANLLFHHVCMLVYGPHVLATPPGEQDFAVSQLNIAPTILGLLGIDVPRAYWGRDVGTEAGRQDNFAVFKSSSGDNVLSMIQGDRMLVIDNQAKAKLYRYDLGTNPDAIELTDPASTADRKAWTDRLLAVVQSAIVDLRNMRAGGDR